MPLDDESNQPNDPHSMIDKIKKSVLTDFELKYCNTCSGGMIRTRQRTINDMFLMIACPVKCNILSKICEYFIDVHDEVRYNSAKGLDAYPMILIKNASTRF